MKKAFGVFLSLLIACTHNAHAQTPDWQTIPVPGAWQEKGPEAARNYHGYAWYRTWVKPDPSFFTKHERNLFEESVNISIRGLADAHEVFVNGVKIGSGGQMPPNYASGKDGNHRHKVPPGTLHKGEWNEIAIRVYSPTGRSGFLTEAPFIMNYFMECVLEGPWEFHVGDDPNWKTGGSLKEKPARFAFEQFHESNRVLGEAAEFVHGDRLPPEESFQKMKADPDLIVEQLLHEPLVAQPVYFSFDERGRLWVAQYRQYPYPAGLKMISRDKYYRAHYDKVPPPPPYNDRGRDIISIHESTKGDGVFDKHTVFQDGLNMVNAALRGHGGVWVMNPPYLMFYPDKNFDDKPDGPPEVKLQGFGIEDTHSVANGIVWGMDGWLYGAQGSTTTSHITRPGIDPPGSPGVYFEGCMVWRYHPDTHEYEIFAKGSGNTFGLEVDAQGRLFSGHNGGTTRGWHYLQGGYYLMQGVDPGKFGPPVNQYAFGDLPMMKSLNPIPRFSHFGAMVEGSAMPSKFMGMMFSLDPLHNVVVASERKTLGATFETSDYGPVLTSGDTAFRPVYIGNAPDGSLYVADMYEHYIAHGQHYQSQIDPTTGRIYRLRGKDATLEKDTNLANKTTDQLITLLNHPNKWHRHTAVRLLGERKDPAASPKLKALIAKDEGLGALCALWALYQAGGFDDATALVAVHHKYAPVRMWAVRLLGDRHQLPRKLAETVEEQAKVETDAETRSQMAASARRLPPGQGLPIIAALFAHDEDLNDAYVPLMSWFALESWCEQDRNAVLELFRGKALWDKPVVFEQILPRLMRRFALEGRHQDLLVCAELLQMAPTPKHAAQLLKGFEEAYRGRSLSGLPDELVKAMAASGGSSLLLRVRQKDANAVEEALKLIQNPKAKIEDRMLYTRALGEVVEKQVVPTLLTLAEKETDARLRKAALAALTDFDEDAIGSKVAALATKLPPDVRTGAFTLLASRPHWSLELLQAMQAGKIGISALPEDVANRLRASKEKSVHDLAAKLLPAKAQDGAYDWQKKLTEVETALKRGTGNPYAGEATFMERCSSCHKLFFKGGNIGPELTHYQRDNLGTMLISIVNPSAEIREGYQYYQLETKDGRSLSGFLADRDNQVTVMRGLDGQDITLRQSEIKDIQPMGRSLMPDGLLEGLDEQQLRDFFAYLRISQPITR